MKNREISETPITLKLATLFAMALLVVSSGCRSKTVVKKLSNTESKVETKTIKGSLYHLPLTVVQLSVPVKLKKEAPGEFSDYAPCFFDEDLADQRIKAEKRTISIEKPTFSQTGVADLDETYVVQTTGAYFESRTIAMTLNKEGVLTEGSSEIKDETLPVAIKVAETAIGLATKAVPFLSEGVPLDDLINSPGPETQKEKEQNCYLQGFDYQINKIDRQIRHLGTISNYPEVNESEKLANAEKAKKLEIEKALWHQKRRVAVKIWEEVRTEPLQHRRYLPFVVNFRNAQRANGELTALKEKRDAIQDDPQNVDAELYKVRLKELDDRIKALREKFFGTDETFQWTGNFEFRPSKDTNGIGHKILFVYSKSNGICYDGAYRDLLAKDGVFPDKVFRFDKCAGSGTDLTKVQIYADRQNDDAAFISRVSNAKMSMLGQTSGWYFRIPAKATVAMVECKHTPNDRHDPNDNDTRCLQNPTEIGRERMLIAQYGVVVWLPSKTAGRSSSLSVTLDESTGALKNFKASSSPLLDQSTIENAGNTGEKIIDAADPLAKKKRELERLEIENKINAERKKLETPTPSPTPES